MGWYPEKLSSSQDNVPSNNNTNSTHQGNFKSGEGYKDSAAYRASDVELLMKKMKELEKKVNSLDDDN